MQFITSTRILLLTLLAYAAGVWLGRYVAVPPLVPVILTAGYVVCCRWFDAFADRHILHSWLLLMLFGLGTLTVQAKLKNPIPAHAYNTQVTFKGTISYDSDRETLLALNKSVRTALHCK